MSWWQNLSPWCVNKQITGITTMVAWVRQYLHFLWFSLWDNDACQEMHLWTSVSDQPHLLCVDQGGKLPLVITRASSRRRRKQRDHKIFKNFLNENVSCKISKWLCLHSGTRLAQEKHYELTVTTGLNDDEEPVTFQLLRAWKSLPRCFSMYTSFSQELNSEHFDHSQTNYYHMKPPIMWAIYPI